MSEETVDEAIRTANLGQRPCVTKDLKIHSSEVSTLESHLKIYGTDRRVIEELVRENPEWNVLLHPKFPNIKAEVILAVRNEMAYTVEDVLARRLRILFVDGRAAMEMSREVGRLMAIENEKSSDWVEDQVREFRIIADQYLLEPFIETEEILITK
jgi:glycerol-3-phosphate dehydrogenase